jgi:integrase
VVAWTHRIAGPSIVARYLPPLFKNGLDFDAVEGTAQPPYAFPNIHVDYVRAGRAARNPDCFLARRWCHSQMYLSWKHSWTALWARKVRAAIAAHNKQVREQEPKKQELPVEASAYSFRHARISELLQIHGVDPLTVAGQTGTSLAMIERAYLRFIPSAMREKLAHIKDFL